MSLEGKVAFITGAAHGQGSATALALAKQAVHIAAFDIARPLSYPDYALGTEDDLTTIKQDIEKLNVECLVFQGDVRKDAEVKAAVHQTLFTSTESIFCLTTTASALTVWPTNYR